MQLCAACQVLVDADPIAVLLRRDELGNNVLCGECRQKIYRTNTTSMSGLLNFTYENPSKEQGETAQHTLCSRRETPNEEWSCKRCRCRVWAKPRFFDGANEPEDWWWCRTCQKEKQEIDKKQRNTEKVEREKQRKKAKYDHNKKSRILQDAHRYPKLDKWLQR